MLYDSQWNWVTVRLRVGLSLLLWAKQLFKVKIWTAVFTVCQMLAWFSTYHSPKMGSVFLGFHLYTYTKLTNVDHIVAVNCNEQKFWSDFDQKCFKMDSWHILCNTTKSRLTHFLKPQSWTFLAPSVLGVTMI